MMGSSGGGGMARQQRQLEDQRQAQVQDAIDRINRTFDGGTYGLDKVDPTAVKWGTPYYDKLGNEVKYDNPMVPSAPTPGNKFVPVAMPQPGQMKPKFDTSGPFAVQKPISQFLGPMTGQAPDMSTGMTPPAGGLYARKETSEGFSPKFYDSIASDYKNYYQPQIDRQFKRAQRDLLLSAPTANSSGYLRDAGDLGYDYQTQLTDLSSKAQGARASAMADVEKNRSDLIKSAQGGVAPDVVAAQAARAKEFLAKPPEYSALGDLFGRYASLVANRRQAQAAGYDTSGIDSPYFSSKRSKSVTTVK